MIEAHPTTTTVLVSPSVSWRYGIGRLLYTFSPPLGLGYVAAALQEERYKTAIIDLQVSSRRHLFQTIRESGANFIGMTCQMETYASAARLASEIRSLFNIPIMMGGPYVSCHPVSVISRGVADVVVRGEGDQTIRLVAERITKGEMNLSDIPGLSYREGNDVVHTPCAAPINDLDQLPFPALDLLPLRLYRPGVNRRLPRPFIPIITSRGCPYGCRYCSSAAVFGKRVRYRSVENVQKEIWHWRSQLGQYGLVFWDDTFTLVRNRAFELCEMLQSENLEWCCTTRPDLLDRDLLLSMRRAGCRFLYFGAESFDSRTLDQLGRTTSAEQTRTAAAMVMSAGIKAGVGIVTRVPGQTFLDIAKDIRALFGLGVDYPTINILSQYGAGGSAATLGVPDDGAADPATATSWREGPPRWMVRALRIVGIVCYHIGIRLRRVFSRLLSKGDIVAMIAGLCSWRLMFR